MEFIKIRTLEDWPGGPGARALGIGHDQLVLVSLKGTLGGSLCGVGEDVGGLHLLSGEGTAITRVREHCWGLRQSLRQKGSPMRQTCRR